MTTHSLRFLQSLLAGASLLASATALAADHAATHAAHQAASAAPSTAADLTDAEVRRIDLANKKITLKHGEIKSISMPAMTMVFQVRDPALLNQVKVGDKVRIAVEKANGALVVTQMQPAQ
jgi:Cu(I)/Ag(I) efflux system protein CusF